MENWGMPDKGVCETLELPHQLYCRKSDVINSKIGVCESAFDKSVGAGVLKRVVLAGERNGRYYTAQVIEVLVK